MEFYHATFFSPAKSTWLWAITQEYLWWSPGLTLDWALKFIQGTKLATIKGHLNVKQQGARSTAIKDDHPLQEHGNIKTLHVFITLSNIDGKMYSDQTGRFPLPSSRGNKYAVIVYVYDANAILSYTIKNWSTGELLRVFLLVYAKLQTAGFKPQLHKLDNESFTTLETFIANNNAALQYTPPEINCTNATKCAVQMWKNNLKVGSNNFQLHIGVA